MNAAIAFVKRQVRWIRADRTRRSIAAIVVALGVFGLIAGLFKLGGSALGAQLQDDIRVWMEAARGTPWALIAVIGVFVGLGFTGFPQFLLIGVTALVFGAAFGFVYSWIATMISATLHFALAKRFGNGLLRRYGGEKTNLFSQRVGERGILASGLVRVIPSAPFIVVNSAAGVSHMPYWKFALGTGLGTIPKTALVAFMGGSFVAFLRSQDPVHLVLFALFVVFWIGLGLGVRHYLAPRFAKTAQALDAMDKVGEAVVAPIVEGETAGDVEQRPIAVAQSASPPEDRAGMQTGPEPKEGYMNGHDLGGFEPDDKAEGQTVAPSPAPARDRRASG